ncbi:hypothetical protein BJ912DRAFT_960443 [Pholiota molesta]|nr:hypothetical protein BJ912DRAFT_960443 [Pholiota molesta]
MSALPSTPNPPSYSPPDEALLVDYYVPIPQDEILPGYSAITQSSSGSGPASRAKGPPIAVLMLVADALYSKNIPTYIGAGPVKGNVRLRSDKVDGVQAIIISIIGRYIAGIEEEEITFLDLSTTVYTQSTELLEPYLWPFRFESPQSSGKEEAVRCTPPQTFAERTMRGSIKYEIGVKIKRGVLKTSYRISAAIGYIPLIRPPSLPLLRSLAYEKGTPWHALDEVRIKVPSSTTSSDIEIGCKLFYTIGSSIPRPQTHSSCRSSHALDELLRTPTPSPMSGTVEAVWWAPEQAQPGGIRQCSPEKATSNFDGRRQVDEWRDSYWERGEASSRMPYFNIEYAVVLLPFTPRWEVSGDKKTEVLQEQAVEMVTAFAPGPRPASKPFRGFLPSAFM